MCCGSHSLFSIDPGSSSSSEENLGITQMGMLGWHHKLLGALHCNLMHQASRFFKPQHQIYLHKTVENWV